MGLGCGNWDAYPNCVHRLNEMCTYDPATSPKGGSCHRLPVFNLTRGIALLSGCLGHPKALGEIDRARLKVNGGSVGLGQPFAATGHQRNDFD
jgi:hypothetical protein